ncbi:MAG: DUF1566 domain-containing protein [Candidatus Hermodarchaeota archaeon]
MNIKVQNHKRWTHIELSDKWKKFLSRTAISITILLSSLWAFWGIVENFHEGWYSRSIWENLFIMVIQYMSLSIIFVILGLVALHWRKIGLGIFTVVAIFLAIFFSGGSFAVIGIMIVIPLVGLGLLFFLGKLPPKSVRRARLAIIIVPLVVTIISGIPGAFRVSQRIDDGNYGMRTIEGNGVTLIWAPSGPGWPDCGISWEEAKNRSVYLAENGTILMDVPQNIWRVPTVDEMVRSQCLHGNQVGGVWNNITKTASYEKTPDKETPLWKVYSKVIYYWTDTEISESRAYYITYAGIVYERDKQDAYAYLSFRAVKDL